MDRKKWISRIKEVPNLITVEPIMILYVLAHMIIMVVQQAFFVHKACNVNHNFSSFICRNITNENMGINEKVQITVAEFQQWNDLAGYVIPAILALYMGAWSDKRGHKLPLLLGLFGKLYYSIMMAVNALQDSWPIEFIIYTTTLPMALTGSEVAINSSVFAYLADVSTQEYRTLRMTILSVCFHASMPIGVALGGYLFSKVTNQSYVVLFAIYAALISIAIIYTFLRLEWRTNEKQRPLSDAKNIFSDFFDSNYVVQTVTTLFTKRLKKRRTYLLLFITTMALYSIQRDEKQMSYLYLQLVLKWTFVQISMFQTYLYTVQQVLLIIFTVLLAKLLGWRDTLIIIFAAAANSIARVLYATAHVGWMIYLGGTFVSLGAFISPVIRSMVSKVVSASERGKIMSILAIASNATPILSGVIYNQIYKNTISSFPSAIYYFTIVTQLFLLGIFLYIYFAAKDEDLIHEDEIKQFEENEAMLENKQ